MSILICTVKYKLFRLNSVLYTVQLNSLCTVNFVDELNWSNNKIFLLLPLFCICENNLKSSSCFLSPPIYAVVCCDLYIVVFFNKCYFFMFLY